MQNIDKSLSPYQHKIADALEDLNQMLGVTYEGFIKHKKALLAEAESLGRKVHEFEKPFVVDAARFERAFGLRPTPLDEAIRATVAWYRAHPAG